MNASIFIDQLQDIGIRLKRDGDDLIADVLPGAPLDPFRDRIRVCKPALLAELRLREQIVTAASAAQARFDRERYDELWCRWSALQEETT
jgi:hypothetical protein